MASLNPGGVLLYKCRLCGKVHEKGHVPSISLAMTSIISEGCTPKAWGVLFWPTEAHYHPDGTIGVADLIGGRADE